MSIEDIENMLKFKELKDKIDRLRKELHDTELELKQMLEKSEANYKLLNGLINKADPQELKDASVKDVGMPSLASQVLDGDGISYPKQTEPLKILSAEEVPQELKDAIKDFEDSRVQSPLASQILDGDEGSDWPWPPHLKLAKPLNSRVQPLLGSDGLPIRLRVVGVGSDGLPIVELIDPQKSKDAVETSGYDAASLAPQIAAAKISERFLSSPPDVDDLSR